MVLATTGWSTPATTSTGENWDTARYNALINDLREIGNAWRTFTPTVVWSGGGSDGNAGSSTTAGGYILTDHLLIVRCAMTITTGGSWAEGTNQWGFDLDDLIDGVTHEQPGWACLVGANGKPFALGSVATTDEELITELTGGSFPDSATTGYKLLAGGVFEHDG